MRMIYGLRDPRTDELRYIGKTERDPGERLDQHIRGAKQRKTLCHRWIMSLPHYPRICILEDEPKDLEQAEKDWIARCRAAGVRLTNGTDGGTGGAMVGEALEKMRKSKTGQPRSAQTRKLISQNSWMKTPEGRAHRSMVSKAAWARRSTEDRRIIALKSGAARKGQRNTWSKKCEAGCQCKRHVVRLCAPDCTCLRHLNPGSTRESTLRGWETRRKNQLKSA